MYINRLFWTLLLVKLGATGFALAVYARVTHLGDAERYLAAQPQWSLAAFTDRTTLTDTVYAALRTALMSDVAVHAFVSLVLAWMIWRVFRGLYVFTDRPLFWAAVLLPHFLVWSGYVGKEALAIAVFLLVVRGCADISVYGRTAYGPLLLALLFGVVLRPHYGLAYLWLVGATLLFSPALVRRLRSFTLPAQASIQLYLALLFAVLIAATQSLWVEPFMAVMHTAEQYFLAYDAAGNRGGVKWSGPADFITSMWWGLPAAIVGPLPAEALQRPIFMPVLAEGLLALALLVWLSARLVRKARVDRGLRWVIMLGFLPAVALALVIHYPFGVFNPGSALRYKQALAPLLYFYPLLLLAKVRFRAAALGPEARAAPGPPRPAAYP